MPHGVLTESASADAAGGRNLVRCRTSATADVRIPLDQVHSPLIRSVRWCHGQVNARAAVDAACLR